LIHHGFSFKIPPSKLVCPECLAASAIKDFDRLGKDLFCKDENGQIQINWQIFAQRSRDRFDRFTMQKLFLYLGLTCLNGCDSPDLEGLIYYKISHYKKMNPVVFLDSENTVETYFLREDDARKWFKIVIAPELPKTTLCLTKIEILAGLT